MQQFNHNNFNTDVAGVDNIGNIFIKNFYLVPTKEAYKDPFHRSYSLNATYRDMENLENVFREKGVGINNKIDEVTIANSLPNIMTISGNVNGVADIIHGWGTQRMRFIMEVESVVNNVVLSTYVQGYSEYYDPSISGKIDPNMSFYINSITNVSRVQDPVTGFPVVRPQSTFNVITDRFGNEQYGDVGVADTPDLKLIRPVDIVDNINNLEMYGDNDSIVSNNYSDAYSYSQTQVSDRANNNPLKHFTKTVNSFITAKSLSSISHDPSDIFRSATTQAVESNILATPFIASLYDLTGVPSPTTFTINILQKISPDLGTRTYIAEPNNTMPVNQTMLDTENTEDLFKNTIESTVATTIAQSVSGMLIENFLSSIDFSVTNITGPVVPIMSDARSFIDGIDVRPYVNKVESRIVYILFPEISHNNQLMVSISGHVDVLGDANISVSINNQPPTIFRFPAFADSLYSPVISDAQNKTLITNDFSDVLDRTYTA